MKATSFTELKSVEDAARRARLEQKYKDRFAQAAPTSAATESDPPSAPTSFEPYLWSQFSLANSMGLKKTYLPLPALQQLENAALSMVEAVRQVAGRTSAQQVAGHTGILTVAGLCNLFLLAKARAGRSDNYCGLLLKELRSFANGRESRPASSITAEEIEFWLHGQNWSAATQRGRLLTMRNLLGWAVQRGELACNVALGVDQPQLDNAPPGIHTPDQVRQVLEYARRTDINSMRCFAIRYFAGLRTSEAVALQESEIKRGFIEVVAAKSKTRRRRLVTIQPALKAWLALGGILPLREVSNRLNAITHGAGVQWSQNVCRHSFVTYHLAKFQNAGKTALEAGHTEQILFSNYREIVTPAQAARFWCVRPRHTV